MKEGFDVEFCIFVIAIFLLFGISVVMIINKDKQIKENLHSYYTYYIHGQSYDFGTKCWENGDLFCETEDRTILKVDAYTPN